MRRIADGDHGRLRWRACAVLLGLWAPAAAAETLEPHAGHGYRAKRGDTSYVYMVPPGLERGICDRTYPSPLTIGGVVGGPLPSIALPADTRLETAAAPPPLPMSLVGGPMGKVMDALDQGCVARTLEFLPDRAPLAWLNRESDAAYQVTPVRTFETKAGQYCREFNARATIDGKGLLFKGVACRARDGRWAPGK